MLLFKQIKPKKLDEKAMLDALMDKAKSIADDIELDFGLTVATWNRDVKFEKIIGREQDGISILVGTDDEIYGYVSGGTEPHVILPRNKNVLAFMSGYKAKTVVGSAVAMSGGPYGDMVFSRGVIHPGIEPRNFDEIIMKDWEKKFKSRMEKAMKKAAKVSNNPV